MEVDMLPQEWDDTMREAFDAREELFGLLDLEPELDEEGEPLVRRKPSWRGGW